MKPPGQTSPAEAPAYGGCGEHGPVYGRGGWKGCWECMDTVIGAQLPTSQSALLDYKVRRFSCLVFVAL
jgi:hypothetical protein